MEQLSTKIDKLSQTKSRVMIVGPSGSGKEAAAHQLPRSPRATGNFISVHTAMLGDDGEQIDRMLFGFEEGGQIEPGLFEQAHGGTLYLDEICSFPLRQQKAILKMLLDGGIKRIGGGDLVPLDSRDFVIVQRRS